MDGSGVSAGRLARAPRACSRSTRPCLPDRQPRVSRWIRVLTRSSPRRRDLPACAVHARTSARWRRPSARFVRLSLAFCGAFPVVRINRSAQNATHGRRARHSAFLRLCRCPTDHTVMGVWPGRPEDSSGRDDGLARRVCRRPPDCCATSREHWGASAKRLQRLVLNAGSTVFCARLVLAISPSGRSLASQDAASAYEIARGVTSGSLLPDAVTQVT